MTANTFGLISPLKPTTGTDEHADHLRVLLIPVGGVVGEFIVTYQMKKIDIILLL